MKLGYYPGCSLEGTARDYDQAIREICQLLGVQLEEIPDWNCCGASSAHMTNQEVAMRLAIRNLLQAGDRQTDILVPCPACFQRLKAADKALREDPLYWDVEEYHPRYELLQISTFLAREQILTRLKALIKAPLEGLAVACYYGCLSLRPPHLTDAPSHEMPKTLETICQMAGCRVMPWSHRTECCSGSLTMTRPDIAEKLVADIIAAARRGGAAALVTDCPMCQANVESRQPSGPEPPLPVYYATELIQAAINGAFPERQQRLHLVSAAILDRHATGSQQQREDSP